MSKRDCPICHASKGHKLSCSTLRNTIDREIDQRLKIDDRVRFIAEVTEMDVREVADVAINHPELFAGIYQHVVLSGSNPMMVGEA